MWLIPAAYAAFLALVASSYARRRPRLADYEPRTGEGGPLVSVIIPARDEALNIERCVRSVLATRYRSVEVIVVDDGSRDATAAIVARLAEKPAAGGRLRLLRGSALPADGDWFGKQWALLQGYRAARGALLLFTDADTDHGPELLPRAVTALERERADLVTVLPRQEMGSFWERLVQPQVFVALAARVGDLRRVNRTRVPWHAIANGQFILTTRSAYEAVGTHAAVRHTVVEDLALAQAYVRSGRDIFLLHAVEHMTTRMYRSLRAILEGWSKNLALGVPLMMPPLPLVRRAVPWLMWLPALCWIVPPLAWAVSGSPVAGASTAVSLLIWAVVYGGEKAPLWYVPLFPLGAAAVAVIMLRSAWRGGRRVEWRGRVYAPGAVRGPGETKE